MSSANVTSLDALQHFRAALIEFGDACHETMVGLDMELRRGMQWMLDEQPKFWKSEERRLYDRVLEARQELNRCRSTALPGEVAPCSEQKHALEKALAQLRHAEEKSKLTKHWGRIVEHDAHEWQGRANQFTNVLEGELPKAIMLLERAMAALEGYVAMSTGPAIMKERGKEGPSAGSMSQPSPDDSPTSYLAPPSAEASDASR